MDTVKKSEIAIKVSLNKDNVPVDIKWKATDSEHQELKDTKSFMVSIWDPIVKNTLSIHLWTRQMQIDEMHHFYMEALMNFTESYQKATGNPLVKNKLSKFLEEFAKETAEWSKTQAE